MIPDSQKAFISGDSQVKYGTYCHLLYFATARLYCTVNLPTYRYFNTALCSSFSYFSVFFWPNWRQYVPRDRVDSEERSPPSVSAVPLRQSHTVDKSVTCTFGGAFTPPHIRIQIRDSVRCC
jgi:hypothetical protein